MPLSALSNHTLPSAILRHSDLREAKTLISQARQAIDQLEDQMVAFELADLFESLPQLSAFSYEVDAESDDEGGSYYYARARANRDATGSDADGLDEDRDLRDAAREWVNSQSEEWMLAHEGHVFRRPSPPQSLLDGLMSQCLSDEAFADWQARALEDVAGSAPSSPTKAI